MTALTILPNYDKKKLKLVGTVAAGEHVAVTVVVGGDWIGEGKSLRLRVLFGAQVVGVFPYWTEDREVDGQTVEADAWTPSGDADEDASCELNLNTAQAEKLLKFGGNCLWVLDDLENHTLYGTGEFEVLPWPRRKGLDVPVDLDGYPDLLADMEEMKAAWEAYKARVNEVVAGKQDAIDDLSAIRSGAAKGDSALQPSDILEGGTVKSSLLPSYVDDVLEFASLSAFPATGEAGKIYVAKDTDKTYRWGGTQYVEIANPDLSGLKPKQSPVADPTADGTGLAFIASITQDANGVVAPTKMMVAVDAALSASSENPVANKAVKAAVDALDSAKQDALTAAQLAAIAAVPDKADKAELPYALVDKTPGEDEPYGMVAITLADHAINYVRQRYDDSTSQYDWDWAFRFPNAIRGRAKDFYLHYVTGNPDGPGYSVQMRFFDDDNGTTIPHEPVIIGQFGDAFGSPRMVDGGNNETGILHFTELPDGSFKVEAVGGEVNPAQRRLTFDTTPKSGSSNPVTSGGVFTALSGKAGTTDVITLANIISSHVGNANNPHGVSVAQIGAVADNDGVANKLLLTSSALAPYTTGLRVYHSRGNNWYLEGVVNGETVGRVKFPEAVVSGGVNNGALIALTSDIENGVLASYEAAESYTPIAATDTVVQAFAKLEAGLLNTPSVELLADKLRPLDWPATGMIEKWRTGLTDNNWLANNFHGWSAATAGNATALVSRNRPSDKTSYQYDHTLFPNEQVVFCSVNDNVQTAGAWFEREVTVPSYGYYEVELSWGCVIRNSNTMELAHPAFTISAAGQSVNIIGEADSTVLQTAKASFLLPAGTAAIRIEATPIASKFTGLVFSQFDFRLVRTMQAELVICDDSLTPLMDATTGAKFESPVGSYAQQNLMHWTGADIGQAKVLRNRPSEETYWQYDTSLFPDQIVLWVEGKTSDNEVGWFERTVAVPVAGIYEVEVAYADGITHKPNGIYGYPFFDIIANNTTYPVEDGARDPTIVQTARQNIYLPAGDQTIRLQARQMPDGSTASAVIIASIKVRFVRTMDLD